MVTDQDTLHLRKDLHQKANQISFIACYLKQESIGLFYGLKCLKNTIFSVAFKVIHACQWLYNQHQKVRFGSSKEETNHAA